MKLKELLDRSIIAESVRPIRFGMVVNDFKSLTAELGRLERRDMDPCKWIISFETTELTDKALGVQFMPKHFIEVAFERIAKGLDRKLVMPHDLTEEVSLFSMARILINCYQWESIQEWINVKRGEFEIEVYIKEIGGEVLSSQVYPDEELKPVDGCSCGCSSETMEVAVENIAKVEGT
ncbi:hypothetical protein PIB30_056674 [Stylosanthes scabra]|uniref:Uncharacterized protein n=1 Tax=Stylosanthes scabra TaxID=79078 RepID=A0ABU6YHZ8_9FABA|nr:hypothetical protein [Stylosanthes scabra]